MGRVEELLKTTAVHQSKPLMAVSTPCWYLLVPAGCPIRALVGPQQPSISGIWSHAEKAVKPTCLLGGSLAVPRSDTISVRGRIEPE